MRMDGVDPGTNDPHFEAERDTRAAYATRKKYPV